MIDGDQLPTIEAPRVRLRWLSESDVDAMFAVFSDQRSTRWMSIPAMTEPAQAKAFIQSIQDAFRAKSLFQWGIERKDDARIVGTCTLLRLDSSNARAEIGYMLGSAYWGQGLMHESLTALIGFTFGTLKLRRIEADVDPRNASSLKSLDRLGFRREGLLRERWNIAGEIQDTVYYGLLAHEFPPGSA